MHRIGGSGAERPNVVVIMSDQHNATVMGTARDPIVRTPHLDRLAEQGVRFSSAYCASPLCVPSRATFLTGQSCSQIGVWTNLCQLNSAIPTFAHAVGAGGYDTALIGRMHFTGPDQRHGFDERLVGDVSPPWGGHPTTILEGLPEGMNRQTYPAAAQSGSGATAFHAFDEDVVETSVEWLHGRRSAAHPFCLVVGMVAPHNPYVTTEDLYAEYLEQVGVPEVPADATGTDHPAVRHWRRVRGVDDLTEQQIRSARAAYYGMVTQLDSNVGTIVAAIEAAGLRDNTVIMYTSDHGDMIGHNGLWWKSSLYEGSVGVPLIISWPARWPSDRVVDLPVSLTDLAPTITALAGVEGLPGASGESLVSLCAAGPVEAHWAERVVIAENVPDLGSPPARMVRRGRRKLVHHHGHDQDQLFDLVADPAEHHDLGVTPGPIDGYAELRASALRDWDGDAVTAHTAQRAAERRVVAAWTAQKRPAEPDLWTAPSGSNIFHSGI